MTEAERLALVTHDQVRLVLQEAELVELATLEVEERATIQTHRAKLFDEHDASALAKYRESQRTETVWIDWFSGTRVSAEIIPFPDRNAGSKQ
jgi:xanthine/CO dehydrogenase XdhC/CoxF family maturation factor